MSDKISKNKNSTIINRSKNVVVGSNFNVDGDVHIGDVNNTIISPQSITMSQKSPLIKTLHALIAAGKIKEAIPQLVDFTEEHNPDLYTESLQLSGAHEAYLRKERLGILSNNELNIERAKITANLLAIIEQLQ
jgi:hypothetical protein